MVELSMSFKIIQQAISHLRIDQLNSTFWEFKERHQK
jgi:hypothetical protein